MTLDFNGFEVSAPDDLRVALCMVVLCAKLEPDSRHTHTLTHFLTHTEHTHAGPQHSNQEFLVDPSFRSHFHLPRAVGSSYASLLENVPELLVVEVRHLQPLVQALARRMAREFASMVSGAAEGERPCPGGLCFFLCLDLRLLGSQGSLHQATLPRPQTSCPAVCAQFVMNVHQNLISP